MGRKQTPGRRVHPNPCSALRGFLHALNQPQRGCVVNTVSKLLIEAGEACFALHDEAAKGEKASRIQCDEIWWVCYAKQKNFRMPRSLRKV